MVDVFLFVLTHFIAPIVVTVVSLWLAKKLENR